MAQARYVKTGFDVDTERLNLDLKSLAYEIEEGIAMVDGIEVVYEVEADDYESVSLTLELTPTEGSIFSGGYEIPYVDNE